MGKDGGARVSRTLIVPNNREEIRTVTTALKEFCKQKNFLFEAVLQTKLCLEEIFTNVVSYAHDDDQEHEVEIIFSIEGKTLTVEVLDDGFPFDPLQEAPTLNVESSLEDRGIGGAGVRLVKQLMTDVRYQRNGDRNHLTMIKET